MNVSTTLLIVVTSIVAVALIVGAAFHVWYAFGLSRVFRANDTDPWRAWVPLMNEAELFRLGRVDPAKAALFLVPVVNVYALVLKIIAVHRVNVDAGRGAGSTALAVLLPPVWATVLGGARPATPIAAPVPADRPAPVFAVAPPVAAPPAAIAPPPAAAPAPVLPAPGIAPAPAPGVVPAPAPAPAVAVPPSPVPPPAAAAPAPAAPVTPPLTRRARRDADDGPAASAPVGFTLTLPSGQSVPVAASVVVLGRNPRADEAGVQYVAVSDEGRSVSKQHARLVWTGVHWTITDLGSTNGVSLVDPSGAESALEPHTTAVVGPRFVLGDAAVALTRGA